MGEYTSHVALTANGVADQQHGHFNELFIRWIRFPTVPIVWWVQSDDTMQR